MRIKLVDDLEFVTKHAEKLKNNDGYCLCALVKDEDTKCMCKDFRNQIKEGTIGKCHCGYFEIVED